MDIRDKHTVEGELCPGWTRENLVPTTTQEWKDSIDSLTSYFRIYRPLRKLTEKETLLITAHGYDLTQARKNVILTALHRIGVLGPKRILEDIKFEELLRGSMATVFEVVKLHKHNTQDQTGDLFGGDSEN